jgi:Vacuolar protein 14 C-terminal Fig4p binding
MDSLTRSLSADLEMTVQILVQIDKLVQLIESPVFTCAWAPLPDTTPISKIQ